MRFLPLILLAFIGACRTANPSDSKGHYENMDVKEAEALALTRPVAISELAPTHSVIIHSRLILDADKWGYAKTKLARAILESGADLIISVNKNEPTTINDPLFDKLREDTDGFHQRISFVQAPNSKTSVWARD